MEMNLYQAVTAYQYAGQNETRKQAAAVMLEKTKGLRKFLADKFHGIYGMRELDSRYLSREDADSIMMEAILSGTLKFVIDCRETPQIVEKTWRSYVHIYAEGALKRAIAQTQGVSKYYCDILVRLKNDKLDLWESSDEDLCRALSGYTVSGSGKIRHPEKVLANLRAVFRFFREMTDEEAAARPSGVEACDGGIGRAESNTMVWNAERAVTERFSRQHWDIFEAVYLRDERLSMKAAAFEHSMTVKKVKKILKETSDFLRIVCSEDIHLMDTGNYQEYCLFEE